jgi:RNA polymerase sigma-19 factor, ECF subfamily
MADYSNETQILAAFLRGEQAGFTAVFNLYFERLYGFSLKLIQNDGEAEDIVQQSFIKLFSKKRDFESFCHIKSFLYISVRNSSLNYLKKMKNLTINQQTYKGLVEIDTTTEYAQVDGDLMMAALGHSLTHLSRKRQLLIELLFWEGLEYKQVAEKLGVSVDTVKSERTRTIAALRKRLPSISEGLNKGIVIGFFLFAVICLKSLFFRH